MSSKPFVALSAALVGASDVAHAGPNRLDKAEYDALLEGLRLIGPEQCRSILTSQSQAHLLEAALEKLRHVLASPDAGQDEGASGGNAALTRASMIEVESVKHS